MRVALYARVSTSEQAVHGLSVDAQIHALDEWAKDYSIVDHYVDLGVSARSPSSKRPELQRMLRDCELGKIDLIAFTKLDRFFRNVKEYYKVEDVLESSHVSWRAIHEDYETETAAGRLKVNIMLAVAQDEADRTSERIKAVFERKREKGLVPTGSVPLGVKLVDGHYMPSEDAEKVRNIFEYYISSRSPAETARKFGLTANGVRGMIRNNTYVSSGVIDRATSETAQNILAVRSQRHDRTDRVYLFSGLLTCPRCGSKLTCVRTNGYTYYRCQKHYDGSCEGYHTSERIVESFLLNHIIDAIDEFNITVANNKTKSVDVSTLRKKQDKLMDLYMDDLIPKEKYSAQYRALQAQIDEIERDKRPFDLQEISSFLDAYETLSDKAKKAFWSHLIKSIRPTHNGFDFTLNYT